MSENRPASLPSHGLTRRLVLALGGLVLVGSLALLAVWHWLEKRRGEELFLHQARTNAEFLTRMHLPLSPQMAQHLGVLTGWQVYFREGDGAWIDAAGESVSAIATTGKVMQLTNGSRAVRWPLPGGEVAFIEPPETLTSLLVRPGNIAALTIFVLVAVGVGAWLARSIIHPLRSLAEALPHIEAEQAPTLPAAKRADELGDVARVLLATREQLRDEKLRRQQAERLAAMGRMSASLAHEVRNPVAAIRLHAELLADTSSVQSNAETTSSLQHIVREAAKIEDLVQQWAFSARPEPPRKTVSDLRQTLQQSIASLTPAAQRARVTLLSTLPEQPILAPYDAIRMSQAVTNLLQNALHASPEHSTINLACGVRDSRAWLTVQDAGPGFSDAALAHFGEAFFSEKEGGMGLGLNVASEVLHAHGGSLQAVNAPAGGALITLELPLHSSPP